MGHLHKRRQNIRNTKIKPKPISVQNTIKDLEPKLQGQFFIKKEHTERVGVHLAGMEDLNGMISTDQTGRFPVKSLTGFRLLPQYWGREKGVLFSRGCISLKNRSYRPLLRHSTSPFKRTCLLIRVKEVQFGLYCRNAQC
jgi:hypothetical protein